MNTKFEELAKGLAQSTTRRQALKKFGVGLAGMALACFGLAGRADAKNGGKLCCTYCYGAKLCVSTSQGCPPGIPVPGQGSCSLVSTTPVNNCKHCTL